MLIGWLLRLLMDGLLWLAQKSMETSEGRPVLNFAARAFAFVVVGVVGLVVGAITIGAVVGFFWLVVWRKILSHVPWGSATWWMWLAGALPLSLVVVGRIVFGRSWVTGAFEDPPEITGIVSWRNRRLSQRLWEQLDRVGVTKRRSPAAYVTVVGEVALSAVSLPFWSSSVRIGLRGPFGRVIAWSGAGADEGKEWRGKATVALARLGSLPNRAGPAQFWNAFPERAPGIGLAAPGT